MSRSIEQLRSKARELIERMHNDAEFQARVLQEPERVLVNAGLPAEVVPIFLAETHVREAEVSGYGSPFCMTTNCGETFNVA